MAPSTRNELGKPLPTTQPKQFVADQLVIATPHVTQVASKLRTMSFEVASSEPDERLGLTLCDIRSTENRNGSVDADEVLQRLYESFERENQGWAPTMGKNRYVDDQVIGGGSMSYGGWDDAVPVLPSEYEAERHNWLSPRPDTPGDDVIVGLVDTPIVRTSDALAGTWYARSQDILDDDGGSGPADRDGFTPDHAVYVRGHSTFVSGLILRTAPGARIVVRGVLAPQGQTDSWTAAKAIVELGQSGIDVLNLSFTCLTADGRPPLALAAAISRVDPRTVIVAAAGNHATPIGMHLPVTIDGVTFGRPGQPGVKDITKCTAFPAGLDSVVAVGALGADGKPAQYSPTGTWVDILAPGSNVSTFLAGSGYGGLARWSGTSFAAALITGEIAAGTRRGVTTARQSWEAILNRAAGAASANHLGATAPVRAWPAAV